MIDTDCGVYLGTTFRGGPEFENNFFFDDQRRFFHDYKKYFFKKSVLTSGDPRIFVKQGLRYFRDLRRHRDSNRSLLALNMLLLVPIVLIRPSPEHCPSISRALPKHRLSLLSIARRSPKHCLSIA